MCDIACPSSSRTSPRRVIFLVEGKKKVVGCAPRGYLGHASQVGANKWKAEYAKFFRDVRVVICPMRSAGDGQGWEPAGCIRTGRSTKRVGGITEVSGQTDQV